MKYIKLNILEILLIDITKIIKSKWDDVDLYGNHGYSHITSTWYCASYTYKFSKIYIKSIKYIYTHSYDDYKEMIPLDVFKCITTLLEDIIQNTSDFDDKLKNEICYHIFKYRSNIIKRVC